MRRRAPIILLVLSMLLGGSWPALACSCIGLTEQQYAERATLVFTGTVTRVSSGVPFWFSCSSSSADPVTVEFDVETVYKGDVGRTIVVHTVANGASCGYTFKTGKRYTIFPWLLDGKLDAGLCRGNVEGAISPSDYGLPEGRPPAN